MSSEQLDYWCLGVQIPLYLCGHVSYFIIFFVCMLADNCGVSAIKVLPCVVQVDDSGVSAIKVPPCVLQVIIFWGLVLTIMLLVF